MKLFPKIFLIIGSLLLIICAAIPNNYSECHSDLSIAGYYPMQSCLPDFVYQLDEVSFYVAIICVITAFTLNKESEKQVSLFKAK